MKHSLDNMVILILGATAAVSCTQKGEIPNVPINQPGIPLLESQSDGRAALHTIAEEEAEADPGGKYIWPIPEKSPNWNRLITCYGARFLGDGTDFHDGIDIGVGVGTPVVATADGIVRKVCNVAPECHCSTYALAANSCASDCSGEKSCHGWGGMVLIRHDDGTYTHYVHLDRTRLKPGDSVKQGQQIGLSGSTGYSRGPHMHFSVYSEWPKKKRTAIQSSDLDPLSTFPKTLVNRLDMTNNNCPQAYKNHLAQNTTQKQLRRIYSRK